MPGRSCNERPGIFNYATPAEKAEVVTMARPTKLTGALITRIATNILTGATYQACAVAAGISYDTFNEYRKGASDALKKKSEKRTENERLLIEFSEAIDRANAELELSLVKSIKTKGKKDWKATAYILQNRFPDRYSERKSVQADVVEWDRESWKKEIAKRRQAVAGMEE